jgi:hypothetical protein
MGVTLTTVRLPDAVGIAIGELLEKHRKSARRELREQVRELHLELAKLQTVLAGDGGR